MFQLHASGAGKAASTKARSPFVVLARAFFEQAFTSESVMSDIHLRQTALWVLAFLLAPGVFLMIELFPAFQAAAIRARFSRGTVSHVDDLLAWIAFLFTTYSMVSTGFITVLAWDSLTFDRRDAMTLGPLPLRPRTILLAKLGALGALLLAASLPINLLNATMFALATSDQAGVHVLVMHFFALFAATVGAGVLSFVTIIMVRATVALTAGPRVASACGPPLQFLCIVGLLCLVIFCPFVLHISFLSAGLSNAMPSAWFVGVFERLRGSPRTIDPRFPFAMLAHRALAVTSVAIVGALVLSVVEFRRHMRFAMAPPASPGMLGRATVSRTVARLMVGRNRAARATSEFILLTLARNRAQQAPIAINAALGAAIIIAALSQTRDLASLMHPRTAVLWIPFVVGYWMTIGMRASFFVPSEQAAAWTFRVNTSESDNRAWLAVRASMVAFIVPRTLVVAALLVPLIGWREAAWQALLVGAVMTLLIEIVALTIDDVPFTHPYRPGHAKLKTRWSVYLVGVYVFAYLPARLELGFGRSVPLFTIIGVVIAVAVALEVAGHRRSFSKSVDQRTALDDDELSEVTTLDLSGMYKTDTLSR